MCRFLVTMLAFLLAAPACSPPAEQHVRVLTWNTRNFFNARRDSPEVHSEQVVPAETYLAQLEGIAAVIRAAQPDLVILQEVENQAVTADLAARLPALVEHATARGNDPRGIDLAVLSRYPLTAVTSHAAEPLDPGLDPDDRVYFARDCLEVHVSIDGQPWIVLGVHFKSGRDGQSRRKRAAEAERTRRIADTLSFARPEARLLIAGDFNAEPDAPELDALTEYPGTAQLAPAERRATLGDPRWGWTLDDIRADPQLFGGVVPGSAQVVQDDEAARVSDHRPLLVEFHR